MTDPCIQAENVGRLLEGYDGLIRWQTAQNGTLKDIKDDVKQIKDALNSRPSWATSIIITALSTICVGLVVFVVTKG